MSIVDPFNIGSPYYSGAQAEFGKGREQQVGMVAGEAAVLADGEFSLADSAEEITLHMADRAEAKHHAERKVRGEAPLAVIASEAILAYMAQTHDGDAQAKLAELTRHLLLGQADPRQLVAQQFKDAPRQYLALQYALSKGEEGIASAEVLAAISDAIADLDLESGSEIKASLNTIKAAAEFAADTDGVLAFQQTYRDVVLGESTLAKTLSLALEQFGGRACADGLKSLIQALGLDLAATAPSTSPTRLQALLKDMYLLEVAVTVLDGCKELCARLREPEVAAAGAQEEKLMRDVIDISAEQWITESRFSGLANNHGALAVDARIAFLGGVRAILKDLPVELYADQEMRQSILQAAQGALDIAIEEEDA